MKAWDDWSDSEITIAVNNVTKKHHDVEIRKPSVDNDWIGDSAGTRVDREVVLGWKGEGIDEEVFVIDYCNSWSDMGPLIVDKSITFNYDTCQVHVSSYFAPNIIVSAKRSKILRAAAIVFLEMNGVKP